MLCAACHMDSATGALTGKRMPDLPGQFGESWSRNITADPVKGIGSWTNGEIAYLLRTGIARDGRYTPPWMVKLPNASDEDLRDIIAFLRSDDPLVAARDVDDRDSKPSLLTKVLCRVAFKPLPYAALGRPRRPREDKVAYGRYLVTSRLLCFSCHSADFKTNDDLQPEKSAGYLGGGNAMPDLSGRIVHTANLTPDTETGIGGWSEAQFRRALVDGIRPDNRPLRYPMVPYRPLGDEDVAAIYAYLRTVPPIRNAVAAPAGARDPRGGPREAGVLRLRVQLVPRRHRARPVRPAQGADEVPDGRRAHRLDPTPGKDAAGHQHAHLGRRHPGGRVRASRLLRQVPGDERGVHAVGSGRGPATSRRSPRPPTP